MLVFLNDRFLPETEASVSIFDRGFLYGDGLFETIRVYSGKLFRWNEHIARFFHGSKLLQINPPLSGNEMKVAAERLLVLNRLPEALVRIHLSRGVGARGYSPRFAEQPVLVISVHPVTQSPGKNPRSGSAVISRFRLHSADPLAGVKHSSRLSHVLARSEADHAGADEALLENEHGHLVEGTSSNLFWLRSGKLWTTPVNEGILPGTTRSFIIEMAQRMGVDFQEEVVRRENLPDCEGFFLTSSGLEILELTTIADQTFPANRTVTRLYQAYREAVASNAEPAAGTFK